MLVERILKGGTLCLIAFFTFKILPMIAVVHVNAWLLQALLSIVYFLLLLFIIFNFPNFAGLDQNDLNSMHNLLKKVFIMLKPDIA